MTERLRSSGDPGDRPTEVSHVATERKRPVISDGLPEPAAGHRSGGDARVDRVARRRHRRARPPARPVRHAAAAGAGPGAAGRRPAADHDRLHQHDPARAGAVVPRRRARRAAHPRLHPVERRDAGAPGAAAGHRRRRPHLHLRQLGQPLRGRLQPLLPGQGPPGRRRPDLLPGPRLPRHVRPRLPGGPADRGTSSTASARSCRTPARAAACRPTRTRG